MDSWADDLLLWTLRRRIELKPDVVFDLVHHAYLADIYRCQAREVVVYKASQMGASEYAISYALHAADQRGATGLYVFPTDTHVSDFSAARLGPAMEASAYLDSIIVDGGGSKTADGRTKRGADRVTLKRVRNRFIYFRGARVDARGQAPQLKSIDADVLILDELDEMDPRAPSIAAKRLGHSGIAETRYISTPTYPERGIHAQWLLSDQREWHVPCPHCGHRQPLDIGQVVTERDALDRPAAWHGQDEGRAWVACRQCGGELNRLAPGEWVAKYPARDIAGFHLSKLFSAQVDLIEVVEALQTTDETKRREAYNQDLGVPYTPTGGQMTDPVLDACRRDYKHGPIPGETTYLGADVGKVIHAVIRGEADAETGERPQRWAGAVESFDELGRLMRRYHVKAAVIDALPETRKVREIQTEFREARSWVIWLAYYATQKAGTKHADEAQWNTNEGVVNLDRTRALDTCFAQFYDGKATLPGNARDLPDYYDHLKAPVRVLEDGPGGQQVARYVESAPDHLAHAENYCRVAIDAPQLPTAQIRFF